jgi:hypothetical protein
VLYESPIESRCDDCENILASSSGAAEPRGDRTLLKSDVSPASTRHEPILASGWYDA